MMNSKYAMTIQAVAMFALAGSQIQAANLIPNGGFQMYKPSTGLTVTAEFTAGGGSYTSNFEGDVTLTGGTVDYSDGSGPGTTIVMPGWVNVLPGAGLFSLGVDGSTSMETFGSWGGSNGQIVGSDASLGTIGPAGYTLSALLKGASGNAMLGGVTLALLADGVPITPSSSVTPTTNPGTFQEISRTYDAASLAGFLGQSMTVQFGTNVGNTEGGRATWDNISLTAIPEPSAMSLLLLGGLALVRRKRH